MDYLFGYDATCDIVSDYQYEEIAQKLILDPEQQKFFKEHNPLALKDASQRLLEANERQMWKEANPEWDKDWSKGVGGTAEVGDWRNKLDGGWNEVLDRASRQPGATVKKYNNY